MSASAAADDRVRATIGWATRILERGVATLPDRATPGEVLAALGLATAVYLVANVEPERIDEMAEHAIATISRHVAACRPER